MKITAKKASSANVSTLARSSPAANCAGPWAALSRSSARWSTMKLQPSSATPVSSATSQVRPCRRRRRRPLRYEGPHHEVEARYLSRADAGVLEQLNALGVFWSCNSDAAGGDFRCFILRGLLLVATFLVSSLIALAIRDHRMHCHQGGTNARE